MASYQLLLVILAVLAASTTAERNVMCQYFGSTKLEPDEPNHRTSPDILKLCTHVIYRITENHIRMKLGSSKWKDSIFLGASRELMEHGHFHQLKAAGIKILSEVRGWYAGTNNFNRVSATTLSRSNFAAIVVNYIQKMGLDEITINWQFHRLRGITPADKRNFLSLLKVVSKAFAPKGFLLGVEVTAVESLASNIYDIKNMVKYVDFVLVMTHILDYSLRPIARLSAPLYPAPIEEDEDRGRNVRAVIEFWLNAGAPAEKLVLGITTTGRSYTLENSERNTPGSPVRGPGAPGPLLHAEGIMNLNEINYLLKNENWTYRCDVWQDAPYASKGDQWVGYDDVRSVKEKAKFIESMNLSGALLYCMQWDDIQGYSGTEYPLLKTLNHVLRNGPPVPNWPPMKDPTESIIPGDDTFNYEFLVGERFDFNGLDTDYNDFLLLYLSVDQTPDVLT